MRLKQQVGHDRGVDLVRREIGETGLRMFADISVRPAVEAALLHARQIVGRQIIAEPVALLHRGVELAGLRLECERRRVAHARGVSRLMRSVRIEPLDRRLRLGLDADIARGADTDKQRAGFWLDGQRAVLMALHNAEHALLAEHLGAVRPGNRLALLGRHLIDAQCFAAARAQRAENVRHAPDAVLVGDQHVIALPGQTVRPVEILDMPVDPHRMAAAVVAQQREIAGALFRDQNVAIRQHQQTSRVDEAGRERRCREAGRHLRGLSGVSDNERPVAHDRSCLRRRQSGRIDAEPPADLVFGKKILLQRVMLRVVLNAGLRARQASLPIDPPKRKRCNGKCSAPHKYETDDHGSEISHRAGSPLQNCAEPTGYKVVRVPFKDGRPEGYYENFITGFWVSGERRAEVWGRPAALAVTRDGALLVADDTGGTIWRIAYTGQRDAAQKDERKKDDRK